MRFEASRASLTPVACIDQDVSIISLMLLRSIAAYGMEPSYHPYPRSAMQTSSPKFYQHIDKGKGMSRVWQAKNVRRRFLILPPGAMMPLL